MLPKPLHRLCGRPMIDYVLDAAEIPSLVQTVMVLSPALKRNADMVDHLAQRVGNTLGLAIQNEVLGTGDALRAAIPLLDDVTTTIVMFADHPLLARDRMISLAESLRLVDAVISLLTCVVDDAAGYGRIERGGDDEIQRIVERKDDVVARRQGSVEINSGMMAIDVEWLRAAIDRITASPATGEFYLTQLVELAVADGCSVTSVQGDATELVGVNDRVELALAESLLQERIQQQHMRAGVTLVAPQTTVIEYGVEIGPDTSVLPGCVIKSGTAIGAGCEIGPHTVLDHARIGDGCRITASFVTDSEIMDGSDVGPFSHVRDDAVISPGVHVGNFAEIKNSMLATGVRVGHVSYLGDASIGERTNVGAGTITCNFDGFNKHRTEIGADVFIGSDTMLVAPVSIGDRAVTGAGSVVTRDVPEGERVAGVPARPLPNQARENRE
jgi:bifunctional UDP-N-acetylglucosamine pyrophosphorylase / glucosamine-1-phosphate N-acetyltransferase